jgi:hypothetical protein
MNFRVGQKVVCVDDSGTDTIKKDAVYTVLSLECCAQCMFIDVTSPRTGQSNWFRTRFRPAVETDISTFTQILDDVNAGRVREIENAH